MVRVVFNGEMYDGKVALKGANFIHILDTNGNNVASFDGIVDFSMFSLAYGEWTVPAGSEECSLAVVHEDGSIGKSGKKCCDVPTAKIGTFTISDAVSSHSFPGATSSSQIIVLASSDADWALLNIKSIGISGPDNTGASYVHILAEEAPTSAVQVTLCAIEAS